MPCPGVPRILRVGAEACRFNDVNRVTDARDEHFGRVLRVVEQVDDLTDNLHPLVADVVETADERTHVAGARFGREPRLRCGEDQRDVDANPLG